MSVNSRILDGMAEMIEVFVKPARLSRRTSLKPARDLADLYEDLNDEGLETMFGNQRKRTQTPEAFGYELARGAIEGSTMRRSLEGVGIVVPEFSVYWHGSGLDTELRWKGGDIPVFDVEGFPRTGHRLVKPNSVEEDLGIENPRRGKLLIAQEVEDRLLTGMSERGVNSYQDIKELLDVSATSPMPGRYQRLIRHLEEDGYIQKRDDGFWVVLHTNPNTSARELTLRKRSLSRSITSMADNIKAIGVDGCNMLYRYAYVDVDGAGTGWMIECTPKGFVGVELEDTGEKRSFPASKVWALSGRVPEYPHKNPAGQLTDKGERMYEDIKASYPGDPRAAEIAMRTVYARAADGVPGLLKRHGKPPGVPNRGHLPGSRAASMDPAAFDPAELAQGTEHELEHTSDRDIAQDIAMDHLAADPLYYQKLSRMERGGKRNRR